MNSILVLLLVAFLALVVWQLVRAIVADGMGHRPLPRSHWSEVQSGPDAGPEPGSPRWWVDSWYAGEDLWQRGTAGLRSPQPRH